MQSPVPSSRPFPLPPPEASLNIWVSLCFVTNRNEHKEKEAKMMEECPWDVRFAKALLSRTHPSSSSMSSMLPGGRWSVLSPSRWVLGICPMVSLRLGFAVRSPHIPLTPRQHVDSGGGGSLPEAITLLEVPSLHSALPSPIGCLCPPDWTRSFTGCCICEISMDRLNPPGFSGGKRQTV